MRQDTLFCSSPGRFGHKTHVYRKLHKILEVRFNWKREKWVMGEVGLRQTFWSPQDPDL